METMLHEESYLQKYRAFFQSLQEKNELEVSIEVLIEKYGSIGSDSFLQNSNKGNDVGSETVLKNQIQDNDPM